MILSSGLLLIIAYLIHQKMIDWGAQYYIAERNALDELSYREVLVQDIMASIFVYLLIFGLYVLAIRTNTFLYDHWMQLFYSSEQFFRRL